jgi:hypothetical protein
MTDPNQTNPENPPKASARKKARALLDCEVGGQRYKANALVEDAAAVIDAAEKAGMVDTGKGAVALADKPQKAKDKE